MDAYRSLVVARQRGALVIRYLSAALPMRHHEVCPALAEQLLIAHANATSVA
jgi:hypothetical protein